MGGGILFTCYERFTNGQLSSLFQVKAHGCGVIQVKQQVGINAGLCHGSRHGGQLCGNLHCGAITSGQFNGLQNHIGQTHSCLDLEGTLCHVSRSLSAFLAHGQNEVVALQNQVGHVVLLVDHTGALAWVSDLKHKYDEGIKKSDGLFTYDYNPHNYPISEEEKDTVIYLHVNTVMGAVASLFTTVLILPKHIWEPVISPEMPINSTSPNEALTNLYQHPVGCGPYVLDREGTNAAQITLKKNPDYFRKAEDGSDLYKVDTIKFILYQEQNVAIFAIKKGYIDILDCSIPANYASLFEKEKDISVFSVPNVYAKALVLNINPVEGQKNEVRSLMSHENFRRAIALSINQEELIRNCLDGAGSTYSAGLISHTLDNLYNPDSDILRGDYEERLKEANAILDTFTTEKDELGYRLYNGKRISFEVLGNPGEQDTISFLQIQLQKVGIELKYAPAGSSPENTYLYHSRFDMTLQGITFSLGTVDIMMNSHFVNLNKSSNYGRLVNDELAAKIDVMRNTLNMDEKTALLKEMQVDIAQLYYKIPLYSANVTSVARTDRFQGYVVAPSQTAFSLETLRHLEFVGG